MSKSPGFMKPVSRACLGALSIVLGCQSAPLEDSSITGDGGAAGATAADAGAPTETELAVLDRVHISSDPMAEHFQRASAELDLGSEPVARATLHVSLESPCFPFSGWSELGVPPGQNWPAACDAFDRTLSITLDEPAAGAVGPPGLELLRAVTAFGGPLELETDVTDAVNGLPGKHQLSIRIDTWSDANGIVSGSGGEWIASVALSLSPGTPLRRVLAVVPLALEAQHDVDAAPVRFDVPAGVGSARIEYRATGHGAIVAPECGGPAEEFCPRTHELAIDGEPIAKLLPWRDDCATLCTLTRNDSSHGPARYCAQNPCGDPDSVRAPRANWCPGSLTDPFVLEAESLAAPGTHELTRSIRSLAPDGTWLISATYFAFE